MSIPVSLVEMTASKMAKLTRDVETIGDRFSLERFGESFEALVDASNGMKNLRSLILKLGLAGRLSTNAPVEPPIGGHINTGRAPHSNWVVCHLPEVATIEMGNSPPGHSYNERGDGVPLINGPVEFSPGPFGLTRRTKFTTAPARMCRQGDLLVCVRGATTGRTNIADFDACIGRGVALVRAHANQEYLNYYMWSIGNDLLSAGTGTTFPAISRDDLAALVVLLPPHAEQKRIVAKVDQIMALCDELEGGQSTKRELGARLTKSALEALTTTKGPEEFETAWKRVAENFDILIDKTEKVGTLRNAVLELAVRGHLVQLRVDDGEVPEFVAAIDGPYALPPRWRWGRVESLASHIVDCLHATPRYTGAGFPAIRTADVIPGRMLVDQARVVDEEQFRERIRRLEPREDDIFYSREGERLGIAACVPPGVQLCLSQRMMHIRVRPPLVPRFIMWAMNSGLVYRQAVGDTGGSTSPHINMKDIRRFVVPIPPPCQQQRIVAKIEQLMKVCDELEAKLRIAENRASKLVEAVVQKLVA